MSSVMKSKIAVGMIALALAGCAQSRSNTARRTQTDWDGAGSVAP